MPRKRLPKGLKLLAVIGLPIGLVIAVLTMHAKRKWNLWNRSTVMFSPYRDLLPYLVALSKVETADLTSKVYQTDNNLFGMKVPTKRKYLGTVGTPAPGVGVDVGNYQHYRTDTQSIRDWFVWADYVSFPRSVSSVEQFNDELYSRKYYGSAGAGTAKEVYLKLLKTYA